MNIVDDLMRHPDDKKTIGLLLVKEKNQTLAKYALQGYTNPIGVAEWEKQITTSLPNELKSSLPTAGRSPSRVNGRYRRCSDRPCSNTSCIRNRNCLTKPMDT